MREARNARLESAADQLTRMKNKLVELQEVWTEERRDAMKGVNKARKEANAYKASL